MDLFERERRERGDVVADLVTRQAARADAARAAVVEHLRALRAMTVEEERVGRQFVTDDARLRKTTVTMSVREAVALVRVLGPIGDLNGDGPVSRLLCAMTIVSRQIVHSGDRQGLGVRAALMVLRVAVDDCMAQCRPLSDLPSKAPVRKRP